MEIVNLSVVGKDILHRVIPMPPDGSCMFHAICYAFFSCTDLQRANEVHANIANYVVQNWVDYSAWTCNTYGDMYDSSGEYRAAMTKYWMYGSSCEVRGAGVLYPIKKEVYNSTGALLGYFGSESNPIKRFQYTGDQILVSGQYNVCGSLDDEDLVENYKTLKNKTKPKRSGRGSKHKGGRQITSDKIRTELVRDADQRFRKNKKHPVRKEKLEAKCTATHLEVHRKAVEHNPKANWKAVACYSQQHQTPATIFVKSIEIQPKT